MFALFDPNGFFCWSSRCAASGLGRPIWYFLGGIHVSDLMWSAIWFFIGELDVLVRSLLFYL
jgi:hypothetical protein